MDIPKLILSNSLRYGEQYIHDSTEYLLDSSKISVMFPEYFFQDLRHVLHETPFFCGSLLNYLRYAYMRCSCIFWSARYTYFFLQASFSDKDVASHIENTTPSLFATSPLSFLCYCLICCCNITLVSSYHCLFIDAVPLR